MTAHPAARAGSMAFLVRGVDGLFLPPPETGAHFALVREGTPEALVADRWLAPAQPLAYRLPHGDPEPSATTAELLAASDIGPLLRQQGITSMLLSTSRSPAIDAWAAEFGITLHGAATPDHAQLEDKAYFQGLLEKHDLPRPAAALAKIELDRPLPLAGRVVVQRVQSMGGEGTFFVSSRQDLEALVSAGQLARGEKCLVRQFIDGRPLGISLYIAPGVIALSPPRLQCYAEIPGTGRGLEFTGIQWLATRDLEGRVRARMDDVFTHLGRLLYNKRFFGFANIDFMLDARGEIYLLECNPRMSAATPQLLQQSQLAWPFDFAGEFATQTMRKRRYTAEHVVHSMPESDFAGAAYDLAFAPTETEPARAILELPLPGAYRRAAAGHYDYVGALTRGRSPEHVVFVPQVYPEQTATSACTLATVLSNAPLYSLDGRPLPQVAELEHAFRCRDARS